MLQNGFFMDAEISISYQLHVLETTILLICYPLFKDIKTILNSRVAQNGGWARLGLRLDSVRRGGGRTSSGTTLYRQGAAVEAAALFILSAGGAI